MKRHCELARILASCSLLVLVRGWTLLPWYGVLRARRAGRLWLLLTRSGALALAATGIGIASLPQRWGASAVIVVGIAGVVGVLVAMLAMGEGFKATLKQTGSDRHRDHPARWFAGRDQLGDHARPGAADFRAGRHRQGPRRSSDRVAGALAGGEPAEQGRRHRCQRAVPRRRSGCVGAAPAR